MLRPIALSTAVLPLRPITGRTVTLRTTVLPLTTGRTRALRTVALRSTVLPLRPVARGPLPLRALLGRARTVAGPRRPLRAVCVVAAGATRATVGGGSARRGSSPLPRALFVT